MKKLNVFMIMISLGSISFNAAVASEQTKPSGGYDERIPLNNSPQMKDRQLANMRSHLKAVQTITELLSEEKFDAASKIAHEKLGLTPEMKKMCSMSGNAEFKKLGLAFHKSGDELGEVLKSKDMKASLNALHTTMTYCVQCHETFRQ